MLRNQPMHSLPAADLLYAVRALPAYINDLLIEEMELARSATTSLENLDKLLKRLEQP